jgi:hypothetical protein
MNTSSQSCLWRIRVWYGCLSLRSMCHFIHLAALTTRSHKSHVQVAQATKFCTVTTNICGSSLWNLLHVTLLVPRILEVAPRFLENVCTPGLQLTWALWPPWWIGTCYLRLSSNYHKVVYFYLSIEASSQKMIATKRHRYNIRVKFIASCVLSWLFNTLCRSTQWRKKQLKIQCVLVPSEGRNKDQLFCRT